MAPNRGRGILRAAVFARETLREDSLLDDTSIDRGLWAHLRGLVATDDRANVPAAIAILLEDEIHTCAEVVGWRPK